MTGRLFYIAKSFVTMVGMKVTNNRVVKTISSFPRNAVGAVINTVLGSKNNR